VSHAESPKINDEFISKNHFYQKLFFKTFYFTTRQGYARLKFFFLSVS